MRESVVFEARGIRTQIQITEHYSGLSNLFLIVTFKLVGQILWLYWAIDLSESLASVPGFPPLDKTKSNIDRSLVFDSFGFFIFLSDIREYRRDVNFFYFVTTIIVLESCNTHIVFV